MNRDEFLDLAWKWAEIMINRDHWSSKIGKCGGRCLGYAEPEDEGMCPDCCEALMKVQAEDDKLVENEEFAEVMGKLKQACEGDKSREYERILSQLRNGNVDH